MSGELTDPLWGTGYGSKRHLVDGPVRVGTKGLTAQARCGSARLHAFADRVTHAPVVAFRPSCARCLKIATKEAQA